MVRHLTSNEEIVSSHLAEGKPFFLLIVPRNSLSFSLNNRVDLEPKLYVISSSMELFRLPNLLMCRLLTLVDTMILNRVISFTIIDLTLLVILL